MRLGWGRPLLGDPGRMWGMLALAGCVLVVVALGLPVRGQAGPDGFDAAADAPVIAFFASCRGLLACLAWPATAAAVIALRWHYFTDTVAGVAAGTGTVLALALLIDLACAAVGNRGRLPADREAPRSRSTQEPRPYPGVSRPWAAAAASS